MGMRVVPRRRFVRLGTVFVLTAALLVPLAATTAGAASGGGTDPTGDMSPTPDCHGDVTSFAGDYADATITVSTTMACSSDPNNDPNWTMGATEFDFYLDVNGDNQADVAIGLTWSNDFGGGVFGADVVNLADFTFMDCQASATWDGDKTFGATVDASCFGYPSSIRMQVRSFWDLNPGQGGSCTCTNDRAPDGDGMSADIADTTTYGYATACNGSQNASNPFPDAGLAADCLKAWSIALGKDNGTFGEDDVLLRSQVASFLERWFALGGSQLTDRTTFPDVNPDTVPNAQVRDEIELLAGAGIIQGFPDGNFHPGDTMSVAQAATFVVRTLQASGLDFADRQDTSGNYQEALHKGILDWGARDMPGAVYPHAPSDGTLRGLLADMLAQGLQQDGKVFIADCAQAQAMGVAPLQRGDFYYRPALDPDGDGVACDT